MTYSFVAFASDCLLCASNGARGFECDAHDNRLSVRNSTLDASTSVRQSSCSPICINMERIVMVDSSKQCAFEATTNLKTFARWETHTSLFKDTKVFDFSCRILTFVEQKVVVGRRSWPEATLCGPLRLSFCVAVFISLFLSIYLPLLSLLRACQTLVSRFQPARCVQHTQRHHRLNCPFCGSRQFA